MRTNSIVGNANSDRDEPELRAVSQIGDYVGERADFALDFLCVGGLPWVGLQLHC
jgi:hypothetical protein